MGRWGALGTPVPAGGEVEVEEAEGHLLPGPITHAGKILSDYQARVRPWIPTYGQNRGGRGGGGG